MIEIKTEPGQKLIELGGGSRPLVRPNVDCRMYDDAGELLRDPQGRQAVDFTADFNKPLPIQSEEWDGVISIFAIEHIGYPNVRQFIGEIFRILKPGGKACIITANTEAQLKWIQANPNGWDNEDAFTSCSKILFGGQDYGENAHRSYFSPNILRDLFAQAGFVKIDIQPYGARDTDICVQAIRPTRQTSFSSGALCELQPATPVGAGASNKGQGTQQLADLGAAGPLVTRMDAPAPAVPAKPAGPPMNTTEERAALYDFHYFNTGAKVGGYAGEGYRDFPCHEITAKYVLARQPESVLELGCARGYIVKRLQDAGIRACGLDISKHCMLTRAAENVRQWDICTTPWGGGPDNSHITNGAFDLCLSIGVLEHIPEKFIPFVAAEMARVCKRGLHGITLSPPHPAEPGGDKTVCTLRSLEWWRMVLPEGHEIVDKNELEQGPFPPEVLRGDGKVKVNVGCGLTMFHHGWDNIDIQDLSQFAAGNGYRFTKHDARQGLPMYNTGKVSLVVASHFLDQLTYAEGLAFLRECRRVLNPVTGVLRIALPDPSVLLDGPLGCFDEVSQSCAGHETEIGKLHSLLHEGKLSFYDENALMIALKKAGFSTTPGDFRQSVCKQILRETLDILPCYSFYMDAIPETA